MEKETLKLSIIIPFYNVEKYIAECLDSVFAQDIPETEYEVICVNDCSPDASRNIVMDYQKKHKNIILIEHETNKMLGAARNTGLKAAKGEYVWFIDSDDYIEKNVLKILLDFAYSNRLDILKFNSYRFNENSELTNFMHLPKSTEIIKGVEYCQNYLLSNWNLLTWSKIFKREFILTNNLFFPEGVYFEDNYHSIKAYFLAKHFSYINKSIYYYRINQNSIMTSKNLWGPKKMADRFEYNINSIDFIDKYDIAIDEKFKFDLINCYIWALSKYRKNILNFTLKELNEFYLLIGNVNEFLLKKYMNKSIYIFYTHKRLIIFISALAKPILFSTSLLKKIINVFK